MNMNMDFYQEDRSNNGRRGRPENSMCFDNSACFNMNMDEEVQVRTNSSNGWPRFDQRNSNGQHIANAFNFGDNHSCSTGYSSNRPEGHIYEEVGPPTHPPPYFSPEMDSRIPSVHQTMDHHFRGSPSSLCSRCSVRCTGHQQRPPSLPMCNCMTSGAATTSAQHIPMQQPFCSLHSSISQRHAAGSPRTLNNGYSNSQAGSPQSNMCNFHQDSSMNELHLGVTCNQHPSMGISNQRYTGTMPSAAPQNQIETNTKNKDSTRSLSPFAFLRKANRDSKASSNTMLDNSSSKSLLMCSRKWLVAIVLTLVLIVVLSIAVGVVVTLTVKNSGDQVTTSYRKSPSVEKVTDRITTTVRVTSGPNSAYDSAFNQKSSSLFKLYANTFEREAYNLLRYTSPLQAMVTRTEVTSLSPGSVKVEFFVYLRTEMVESRVLTIAKQIEQTLYNSTFKADGAFYGVFPIDRAEISVEPNFDEIQPTTSIPTEPSTMVTDLPTTTTTTTIRTTTIRQAICEPITEEACQGINYNSSGATFPNFVGDSSQAKAAMTYWVIGSVARTHCYEYINTFACSLIFPKCGASGERIPPCRRMCEDAYKDCQPYLDSVISRNSVVNCSSFPDSTDPTVCVSEHILAVPSSCPEQHFACDNGTCHQMKDRCDAVADCEDGGDEKHCDDFTCVEGQFQCGNGNCRPNVWKCDHRDDCGDGSDEEGCEPVAPCAHGEFKCADGHDVWEDETDVCIDGKFTCDSTSDCSDGSDEDVNFCKDRLDRTTVSP